MWRSLFRWLWLVVEYGFLKIECWALKATSKAVGFPRRQLWCLRVHALTIHKVQALSLRDLVLGRLEGVRARPDLRARQPRDRPFDLPVVGV